MNAPRILSCTALVLAATVALAAPAPPEPRPAAPASVKAEQLQRWEAFNRSFGDRWQIEWNAATGAPRLIAGHALPLTGPVRKENVEALSRALLTKYADVFQIDVHDLALATAAFEAPRRGRAGTGTWRVAYTQAFRGVPVVGGSVRMVIRGDSVTSLRFDYFPGIAIATEPAVALEQALQGLQRVDGAAERGKPISARLVVLPTVAAAAVRYQLAWDVVMPPEKAPRVLVEPPAGGVVRPGGTPPAPPNGKLVPVQWRYFVDARTGDVIRRTNLIRFEDVSGTVTGQVHPKVPADTPEERPILHLTISFTQGAVTSTTETGAGGAFHLTGLTSAPGTLTSHFEGPHVRVWNDETPDPDATHTAALTPPTTHSWSWTSDDPSPDDVETNAFYHVNLIRDWFSRGAPFDVTPQPDPMSTHVRVGAGCNAWAASDGLHFYSGKAGTCQDFALCADIVYHEFTHRIVDKVYTDAGVDLPYQDQTGAMNEAWADYFGCSNTNDPGHGTGCYTGRHIDTPDARYPDDWVGEVHADGVIFSGALWDVRSVLGAAYVDSLAMRAMKDTTTGFSDYLGAVLEEDDDPAFSTDPAAANNNPADGTPNIATICHAYHDLHGIYHPYCSGHTEQPVAVITSPTPMTFNLFNGSVPLIPIAGSALGSVAEPLQAYVIEWAQASAPTTWAASGVTLAGGGLSPVNDGALGQLDITAIPDGVVLIRLTATTTAATSATAQTAIVIDRALKTGWPTATDEHFYASPAAADLDPVAPGLEIVAAGTLRLHAWHADGTEVAGWPQTIGFTLGSPAVADLDLDGKLEVVAVTSWGSLWVFRQDGSTVPGWPQSLGSNVYVPATPAIVDLDGDGDLEVVIGVDDMSDPPAHKVYALHHDGSSATGWPITVTGAVHSSAAVGDVDGDGRTEVFVGSNDGKVYGWRGDGTPLVGWPQVLAATTEVSTSAALGDLDGDGTMEIVIATKDFTTAANQKVYAWHADGSPLAGWPQDFVSPPAWNEFTMSPASVVLADLDGDGSLEVIVMANDDNIHVWHGDGTPFSGWPPAGPGGPFYEFTVSSPAVADIDGDGSQDVVAEASHTGFAGFTRYDVYAFHHDGALMSGWPKALSLYSNSSPAIADVDGDGLAEIAIGSDGVFLWEMPGAVTATSAAWPFYRHDVRRTGAYGPNAGVVLLFDTSGSMSWRADGSMPAPPAEQRITAAKSAAIPFLEMLNDFNANRAAFGIATFPSHPSPMWPYGCTAQVVTPMTRTNDTTKAAAVTATIPGLVTEDNTPLLAGMATAGAMFGVEPRRAIVLLSDGYHNCPSLATVGDPEVTALLQSLQRSGTRVFTIGFGCPTDADHPLLQALADQTTPPGYAGSQFYDVTTPAFDPATWDPVTALQATYKAILTDALDLQSAVDPLGVIGGGQTKTFKVRLGEHDRKVSFYLSWPTPQHRRLALTVRASDGSSVPSIGPGVRVHDGDTYSIVTVDRSFLAQPGKVGPSPWTIEVTASGVRPLATEHFQYGVIVDSSLRLDAALAGRDYKTGDRIKLTARVTEAGKPVVGLRGIALTVSAPSTGLGSWLARTPVSAQQLATVADRRGTEVLAPFQRKAIYLSQVKHLSFPSARVRTVPMYDDGTHGDAKAHDGVYTATLPAAAADGVYAFQIHAAGPTPAGNGFDRDRVVHTYVPVAVARARTGVTVARRQARTARSYSVTITPRDALGNYLGPGHATALHFKPVKGELVGPVRDNLDGSYEQVVTVAGPATGKDLDIGVRIVGTEATFNLGSVHPRLIEPAVQPMR